MSMVLKSMRLTLRRDVFSRLPLRPLSGRGVGVGDCLSCRHWRTV